ncbi:uncharacterized protein LOC108103972 [Drosophila eugracilis]|uniref:uncharacterized protein LOC108103972 n=1 Tax=Drosophila eugracilis TaxID=29029 RepID=UPI0007E71CCB|nr:uncharacterized protein LOC108103972 [Drosophila eugracilis]
MDLDLSRDAMIEQLKKRGIHLSDVESMSIEQLEDIYRKFVIPKPRREREHRDRSKPIPMEMEQLAQRIKSVAMVGQKRPLLDSPNDDSPKQIKMDLR